MNKSILRLLTPMVPRGHLGSLALVGWSVRGLSSLHLLSLQPSRPPMSRTRKPLPTPSRRPRRPCRWERLGCVSLCDVATLPSAQEVLVWDEGWPLSGMVGSILEASWAWGHGVIRAMEAWRKASDPDWLVRDFPERVRSKLESEGGLEFFRWRRLGRVP